MAYGANFVGQTGTLSVSGVDIVPEVMMGLVSPEDASPALITLLAQMPQHIETVGDTTYRWNEIQHDEPDITLNTAISATAASTLITNKAVASLAVGVGDLFHEPTTGTNLEVHNVDSYDEGAGTAQVDFRQTPFDEATPAIAAGAMLIRLGTNFPEGGWLPNPKSKKPVRVSNNLMQMADQIEVSNLQSYMQNYYGPEWELQKKNANIRVTSSMERRTWFSKQFEEERAVTVDLGSHTGAVRGSAGIIERTTSVTPYSGTIDEATLDQFLVNVVWGGKYPGSDVKWGFCGPQVLYGISQFVKNRVQKVDSVPQYGLHINEYISPVGGRTLYLLEEREFKGTSPTNGYANTMAVLDMSYLSLVKAGPTLISVGPSSQPGKTSKAIGYESYWGIKQMLASLVHHILTH